ncbi:MAG: ribokinase [Tannerellaceae bacterium]|jgi:ribokinase|nr:ribokinase [Tannerellaceae bacterium]
MDNTLNPAKKRIVVVGSSNTDMVVKAKRLPVPGETILGGTFLMSPGGKGANQSISIARLGADVVFVSKIGNDLFGMQAREIYKSEMIDTRFVFTDEKNPSGVALISIDTFGENCIIVAAGANMSLTVQDIDKAYKSIQEADMVLLQLEIPLDTVEHVVDMAYDLRKRVILNPAPAAHLSEKLMKKLYAILPNRIEAEMLTGIKVTDRESARKAAGIIRGKGVDNVVITLGKEGAYVDGMGCGALLPGKEVETADTTGAGDVFCGAFSVYMSEGRTLTESVAFANAAASVAVTRIGAQSSIPYRYEIDMN